MTKQTSGHAGQTASSGTAGGGVRNGNGGRSGEVPDNPTLVGRLLGSGGDEDSDQKRWSAVTAVVGVGVTVAIIFLATVYLLEYLGNESPEAALSLVFVSAGVVLILVVCMLAIVLKRLGLDNRNEAMALPAGSVRAIIALLLIMLFFIASIFLFNGTKNETGTEADRTLNGVSAEKFALIPTEQIFSAEPETVEGVTTYDLVLYPASLNTQASDDIAKQLITTVATLVTAVAAFYFGSSSVSAAKPALETKAIPTGAVAATMPAAQESTSERQVQDEEVASPEARTASGEQTEQQTDGNTQTKPS